MGAITQGTVIIMFLILSPGSVPKLVADSGENSNEISGSIQEANF